MTSVFHDPNDVHALKCELAAEVLRFCGTLRLPVVGTSMLPAIWPGDTLFIENAPTTGVSEGDIVLFGRNGRLFAHRVVQKLAELRLLTCGDTTPRPDPVVDPQELLGIVSLIVRNGKHMAPRRKRRISERAIASVVRNSQIAARVLVGVRGRHLV